MATTKTATKTPAKGAETTDKPAPSGLGFELKPRRADVADVRRNATNREPNPTEEAVKHSHDTGEALAFDGLPDGEAVKKVEGFLRRAASDAGHGIKIRATVGDDGTHTVTFQATKQKRERQYTVEDIRTWAETNGFGKISGKVPANVRDAFKTANGYAKTSAK